MRSGSAFEPDITNLTPQAIFSVYLDALTHGCVPTLRCEVIAGRTEYQRSCEMSQPYNLFS